MQTYTSPTAFMRTSEGRLTAFLLAGAVGMAACSGTSASSGSAESTSAASSHITINNCKNGDVVNGPNGTQLYCEELQAGSADVFRDIRDLFNSKEPEQLRVGQTVLVKCVQAAPLAWAPSANGNHGDTHSEWYVLPDGDVTAANNFWNVDDQTKQQYIDNHTPLTDQPAVDKNVPSCGPAIE